MKKFVLLLVLAALLVWSCTGKKEEVIVSENPFFSDWDTPFQTPPFEKIKEEHYLPAMKKGMEQQKEEIDAIAQNAEAPTFENTVAALDSTGALLAKVTSVFYNMMGALTNDELQSIAKEASPLLSKHRDDITLNEQLFGRVKAVYDQKDDLSLIPEQGMLLEKTYKEFVRGGANLDAEKKARMREINKELSLLSLKFSENILKEDNAFELLVESEGDLAGLPQNVVSAAAETAKERGHEGQWIFTLHKPSLIPFLQYSEKRSLREKMFKAYINRGDNNNELDNKEILTKMVALRLERANLLDYKTHAHYILERNMAKQPENVYNLLYQIWEPALKLAKKEAEDIQAMIGEEGKDFKLEPWDWWYYAEKVKKAKYALDDELLRPYFKLENVREGAFAVANKLFGITFEERTDIPKYHEDVEVFEVKEADGTHIGIFYTDYFPRPSKRGGAWMNAYRPQWGQGENKMTPVICNVCNFSKPTAGKPSLLSYEEVETLFHEFGHALHGLLSNVTYRRLAGTNVPRDFVELPSQIMENWAASPEVIKMYARHYETSEVIPQELIDKMQNASFFNQGFAWVERLAASFLDMDWHTLTEATDIDPLAFETASFNKIGLIPEIVSRYRSPYFSHIFAGGYSSGYYSYTWSEVLDSDAFEAFKEAGLFDQETAQSYRENILEKGGSEDPMILYVRFRGRDPVVEPLLKKTGLISY